MAPPPELSTGLRDMEEGTTGAESSWSVSSTTAPPSVLMASAAADSMASQDDSCNQGATEIDTASSSSGPRKSGVRRNWKFGVGPDSRPHVPGRISPLEQALRQYGDRAGGPIILPRPGLIFDSKLEAFDYYNMYSWEIGFGIRYGKSQNYSKNNDVYRNMQLLVCGCAGKPEKGNTNSVRCCCPALVRLLRTDDNGWYIQEHRAHHNHPLSLTCGQKKCWPSHHQIDPHTKELIRTLRENNVSLTRVYCILNSFFGSNSAAPITKQSLRNLCGQLSKENAENDVKKTLALFNKMQEADPNFAHIVDLDEEGRIRTLMWSNGKSRQDYQSFGDAITFDTTYKTNLYNMPFGLFVGVNNHFQTVIFAGVLMRQETIDSFKWVFTSFVSLMGGKPPKTILTDQCRAMEVAISEVLGGVVHRWCKWHVLRLAKEELGPLYTKNDNFKAELHQIVNNMLTVYEFESAWTDLLNRYGVEDHPFLTAIYEVRHMWAKPYFAGKFCAKQTSTQRSESANHMLKSFVPPAAPMHVFVEHYNKLLADRWEKEDKEVHQNKLGATVITTGWPLEMHAAEHYTNAMLKMFVEHIKDGAAYDVVEVQPRRKYQVVHFQAEKRARWCRGTYDVEIREDGGYYNCECGLAEHMGMLCCHAIRVMIQLGVRTIPEDHLLRRWTRRATNLLEVSCSQLHMQTPVSMSRTFRNTSLHIKSIEMVSMGDSNPECYEICMAGISETIEKMKLKCTVPDGLGMEAQIDWMQDHTVNTHNTTGIKARAAGASVLQIHDGVKPPARTPQVGRPTNARDRPSYENTTQRTRRCRLCRKAGHKTDRCPDRDQTLDKARALPRCTKCRLTGHTRANCSQLNKRLQEATRNQM